MHSLGLRIRSISAAVLLLLVSSSCDRWPQWEGWREWMGDGPDPAGPGPYSADYFEVTLTNPDTGHRLPTIVWHPVREADSGPAGAPYPALVFAHGALANPMLYPGNAQHLATWGYVVAVPHLPEKGLPGRVSDALMVLGHLEREASRPGSRLEGLVDPTRLGMAGHSLGGLTALAAAARDPRIHAVVALDPVNPPRILGMTAWDVETEGRSVAAPSLVMGAPAQRCNYFANYEHMYPLLGPEFKAKIVVSEGNHCDFMFAYQEQVRDGCYRLCSGSYSGPRAALIARYTVAWLNYHLAGDASFHRYLYGDVARDDVAAGVIQMEAEARPTE